MEADTFTIGKPMNIWRQFLGSFLPNWLSIRAELRPGAKLVYARLAQFAGKDGRCYPSIDTLASECGIARRSIIRHIAALEKYKLIRCERKEGVATGYVFLGHEWMVPRAAEIDTKPVPNMHPCQNGTGAKTTPHRCQNDTGTSAILAPKENHKENQEEKTPVGSSFEDVLLFAKAIAEEYGGTGIPSTIQQKTLAVLLESAGPDRLKEIAAENETAMAGKSWGYRIAVFQNHKTKPIVKMCPKCGKGFDGCKNLRTWAHYRHYLKIANASTQIKTWIDRKHFYCPKCGHREELRPGEFETIKSEREAGKQDRRKRTTVGAVVSARSAMSGVLNPSPPKE